MGVYLEDNPPRIKQYRKPRRASLSGVIVLHSAENLPDVKPPDTGSLAVARFIRDRTTYGSYHWMCDSDSHDQLVDLAAEAFHVGVFGINHHSVGISGAFRAHQFDKLPKSWQSGCVHNMAIAAKKSARTIKAVTGIVVPPRRITVTQARNKVPGFITHGMLDPSRRSDPDGTNTGNEFPWEEFFTYYTDQTVTPSEDEDMFVELIRMAYKRSRGAGYEPSTDAKDQGGWTGWMIRLAFADTLTKRLEVVGMCNDAIDHEIARK